MFTDKLLLLLLCNLLTHHLSSCSGLSGLARPLHHIYSQASLTLMRGWGLARQRELFCEYSSVCSLLNPTPAERLMIISGQKQVASARLFLPLESQSRREQSQKAAPVFIIVGCFCFLDFFPSCCISAVLQLPVSSVSSGVSIKIRFLVSFNKQSVQAFTAVGEDASGDRYDGEAVSFICQSVAAYWHDVSFILQNELIIF